MGKYIIQESMKAMNFVWKLHMILSHLKAKIIFGKVGARSFIIRPMRIIGGRCVEIGKEVTILHNLRLEAMEGYNGVKYHPQVIIGDRTNIEQNVHITCANKVVIGRECSILGGVLITDITHPYEDIEIAPKYQCLSTLPVFIGEQTMIGMGAKIMPGVCIGKHCVVGANAVVTKDIPDYSIAVGIPAEVIKKYNSDIGQWIKC